VFGFSFNLISLQ